MILNKKILIIIFIWALITFFYGLNLSFFGGVLFWVPLVTMILIIVYQIFHLDCNDHWFVLAEIFMLYLFLHLVYQVGYFGLRGSDSYYDYVFFKSILYSGHFTLNASNSNLLDISGWPMLHILSVSLQLISNIGSLEIAKYLPSLINSLIILPVYILANAVYGDKRVSLLSCLILGTIPQFVNFDALFVRESIAVFMIPLLIYVIYASKMRDKRFTFLFLILLPVLILSQHFASFIFIIFLIIYLMTSKLVPFLKKDNSNYLRGRIDITSILLLSLVALLAYWIYSSTIIWDDIGLFINSLLGVNELSAYVNTFDLGSAISNLYASILYYGFFVFYAIIGLILLIKLFMDKNKEKIEDVSFTLFLFFSGIYAFLGAFFLGSLIIPTRLLSFGWILGVLPLSAFILTINNHKSYQRLFLVFLISFMLFNIYNISPLYINKDFSSLDLTGSQENAIANTIIFPSSFQSNSSNIYFGYIGVFGPIYDEQGIFPTKGIDLTQFKLKNNLNDTSYIVIINENLYSGFNNLKLNNTILTILSFKNESGVDKIADLGNNIYVLKGGK